MSTRIPELPRLCEFKLKFGHSVCAFKHFHQNMIKTERYDTEQCYKETTVELLISIHNIYTRYIIFIIYTIKYLADVSCNKL